MTNPQEFCDQLANQILEKGYAKPEVRYTVNSDAPPYYSIVFYSLGEKQDRFRIGSSHEDAFADAQKYVDELPEFETVRLNSALQILSDAVATAKDAGVEFDIQFKKDYMICAS